MKASRSVFLSYRRDPDFPWAMLLWKGLRAKKIDAFLDLEDLTGAGEFDKRIFAQISARPYFLPILTTGSLVRCKDPNDWVRQELEHAVRTQRTIVPIAIENFDYAEAEAHLPPPLAHALMAGNGIRVVSGYFEEAVTKLVDLRLKPSTQWVDPLTPEGRRFAEQARQRAERKQRERERHPTWRARWIVAVSSIALLVVAGLGWRSCSGSPTQIAASTDSQLTTSGSSTGSDPPTTDVTVRDRLEPDQFLTVGDQLISPSGATVLRMSDGGQLVGSTNDVEWFRSADMREAGGIAVMQGDGNLVIYPSPERTSGDDALWQSETTGHDGAHLVVKEREGGGWIEIVDPDGQVAWHEQQFSPPVKTEPPASTAAPPTSVATSVPIVAGLEAADALAVLEGDPYRYQVTQKAQPDPSIVFGLAIRTGPAAGTPLDSESSIDLFVSSGPKSEVPDVFGKVEADARRSLTDALLTTKELLVSVAPGDPNDGRVMGQSVAAGQQVPVGTTITIKVGKAAPIPTTTAR